MNEKDIILKNNIIVIINLSWCVDLNININKGINYWALDDYTYHISKIDFSNNKEILDSIFEKIGVNELLDELTYILFCDNYKIYEKNKKNFSNILSYCKYIVVNNNNDVNRLKLEVSSLSHDIDIIFNSSKNIFDNIDLFKYICQSIEDKKFLINLHITDKKNHFYDTQKILNNLKYEQNDVGLLYQKNMNKFIGIYGDIENCFEIRNICSENNINFLNYISDEKNLIDWDSFMKKKSLKEKKKYWLTEGLKSGEKIQIYSNCLNLVPQIPTDHNFLFNFHLYKKLCKDIKYNKSYSEKSYKYFFYYLIAHSEMIYKGIE